MYFVCYDLYQAIRGLLKVERLKDMLLPTKHLESSGPQSTRVSLVIVGYEAF